MIRFGTDGIRGLAVTEISNKLAYKCGQAVAKLKKNARIVIAKDTRNSGDFLLHSFVSGALSLGADIISIGVAPTPCVSYLVKKLGYDFGIVISASHNPTEYNGIKIFESNGQKLTEVHEHKIEKYIKQSHKIKAQRLGNYNQDLKLINIYKNHLKSVGGKLENMKVVLDCSNGASYKIAPSVFRALGAIVKTIGAKPNGLNINKNCGALDLSTLQEKVVKSKADVGFAFDGDADRVIAVDGNGQVFDGDQIIQFLAKHIKNENKLKNDSVISTILTNTAIEEDLKNSGIKLVRSDVGDKYVIKLMNELNLSLGGEQSGHIIIKDYAETGDGVLTAVIVASYIKKYNVKLEDERVSKLYYQTEKNIKSEFKNEIIKDASLLKLKNKLEKTLNGGRIILRASGTEPKVRIMVETKNKENGIEVILRLEKEILKIIMKIKRKD